MCVCIYVYVYIHIHTHIYKILSHVCGAGKFSLISISTQSWPLGVLLWPMGPVPLVLWQQMQCQRLYYDRKVSLCLAMTNLDSILKGRDITLPTKVHLVKAMVFPVVVYGCESWTIKKAECQRIDAFELWCWKRLLRVPWIARKSNQSIPKDISPEYSLEGLMLKL